MQWITLSPYTGRPVEMIHAMNMVAGIILMIAACSSVPVL